MGDAADDAFDSALSFYDDYNPDEYDNEYYDVRYSKNKWRDAKGTLWNISDMTESHIRNCINQCIRLNNTQKLQEFRDELSRRNNSEPDGYEDFLRRIGDI